MTLDDISRILAPFRKRLANVVSRVVVKLVDDSLKMQLLQIEALDGETRDEVERVQNYGFTSVPLAGAEGVALFVGGVRDHGLVIAMDDRRYRLKALEDGEVAMYSDQGDKIVIKRGGTIEVTASTKVVLSTPLVEIAGSSNPVAKGDTLNSAITTLATAIAGALTTMGAGGATPMPGTLAVTAGTTVTTAVTAFNASAAAALSTKVKLS